MPATTPANMNQVRRPPASANLYDILELILDKGLVIDAFVRVSLAGVELLTIDLRVVVASVDTYLRYAEAVESMGLWERDGAAGVDEMIQGGKGGGAARGLRRMRHAITGDGGRSRAQGGQNGIQEKSSGFTSALTSGARTAAGAALAAGLVKGMERMTAAVAEYVEREQPSGSGNKDKNKDKEKKQEPQSERQEQPAAAGNEGQPQGEGQGGEQQHHEQGEQHHEGQGQ